MEWGSICECILCLGTIHEVLTPPKVPLTSLYLGATGARCEASAASRTSVSSLPDVAAPLLGPRQAAKREVTRQRMRRLRMPEDTREGGKRDLACRYVAMICR